jgi:hypothetical protein
MHSSVNWNKKLVCHSATRYMSNGNSEYCRCSHNYYEHRKDHSANWYDAVYGKRVVPACIKCNCEKFTPYPYQEVVQ